MEHIGYAFNALGKELSIKDSELASLRYLNKANEDKIAYLEDQVARLTAALNEQKGE